MALIRNWDNQNVNLQINFIFVDAFHPNDHIHHRRLKFDLGST